MLIERTDLHLELFYERRRRHGAAAGAHSKRTERGGLSRARRGPRAAKGRSLACMLLMAIKPSDWAEWDTVAASCKGLL